MVSAEEAGIITGYFSDAAEDKKSPTVLTFGTTLVSQATKTPAGVNNSALPIMPGTPYQGKRLILSFTAAAADIIESEESALNLPIGIVNEATKALEVINDYTLEDFTGFKPSGTVDITCAAGVPARLCYMDAPQGKLLTLGAGRKFHAYIGDDTA